MKSITILKIALIIIPLIRAFFSFIEYVYVSFFNKPIFVHFYLVKKRLPSKGKLFLEKHITFYKKLPTKEKIYFEHRVVKFIRNYDFIGRNGFEITPQVKVLIASSYIKLTFGMRRFITNVFEGVVVYPEVYYSNLTDQYHKGEFNPKMKLVVFSWEDFLLGDIITNDNLNLGIHEFSHIITFHGNRSSDISAGLFYKGFKEIVSLLKNEEQLEDLKKSNLFRPYAFSNQLEFIAVVLECFFESPEKLQQQHPVLYKKVLKMLNYKSALS